MVRSVCLHKEWVSSTTRPKLSRVGGVGSEVGGVGAGVGSSGCGVGGTYVASPPAVGHYSRRPSPYGIEKGVGALRGRGPKKKKAGGRKRGHLS